MIWNILVYAIVAVGVILLVALTVFRIDWARHPEKYKEKAKKQQKRLDKVNHYRAIAGQKPLNPSQLNKKSKK